MQLVVSFGQDGLPSSLLILLQTLSNLKYMKGLRSGAAKLRITNLWVKGRVSAMYSADVESSYRRIIALLSASLTLCFALFGMWVKHFQIPISERIYFAFSEIPFGIRFSAARDIFSTQRQEKVLDIG